MSHESDLTPIDVLLDGIKTMLDTRYKERIENLTPEILNREELERAKYSFEIFKQQRLLIEIDKTYKPETPIEEILKTRTFKSEDEKNLFVKVYALRNKPKETYLIPFPAKAVKRIVINGKPYVEFDGKENGFAAKGVGENKIE